MKYWMAHNFLLAKSEILLFGPLHSSIPFQSHLGNLSNNVAALNLGVMFEVCK